MGTTALRQLLRSLCNNSHWKYAVLWKLGHGDPMVLTWEDGYIDNPKPRELTETVSDDIYGIGSRNLFYSLSNSGTSDGNAGAYPIGLVVSDMSHVQYALGEGVVGNVASTGEHCWLSFNNIFTGELNPKIVPECPEEWLLQFASGIKTILLVPVLPHGVLQLGSLDEVAEDIETVAYVKDKFNGLQIVWGTTIPSTLKRDFQGQLSSSPISCPTKFLNTPLAVAAGSYQCKDLNHPMTVNSVKIRDDNLLNTSPILPLLTVQDAFRTSEDLPQVFKFESKSQIDGQPIGPTKVSTLSESININQLEIMESKQLELSCLMQELELYSQCNNYDIGVIGEPFDGTMSPYPARDVAGLFSESKDANETDLKSLSSFLSFPRDSELHKALGPVFKKQITEDSWDPSLLLEDTFSSSSLMNSRGLNERTECPRLAGGVDGEYQLQAVMNVCGGLEDTFSNRSSSFKSSLSSSSYFVTSPQLKKEVNTLMGDDSVPWSHDTSKERNANTSADLKSIIDTIYSKEQQEGGSTLVQPKKGQKMSNASKRKARPGDSQRPRPRDRQLLQDRVKELRELVPNGAKCSIDGLLHRTIKHMLYLRSAADQAQKLKQWVHEEVNVRKNWRSSEAKGDSQNGTSWAFEFGNEFQACPIVVEDLAHPGHILIEMLCDEHGQFFEIAQVIRGLELTILKGVIESRSSNTWAHFIVEASKSFHRLDIFWPLMQLLQRKRKTISSKI